MIRFTNRFLLLALSLQVCGCSVVRNIEQWKCDKMGMCHFGITPTAQPIAPLNSIPYQYPPINYSSEPSGNSLQVYPQSSPVYSQSHGVPANNSNCAQCQK
jgi:hypothetical protein